MMYHFFERWHEASWTSVGFFWMALWAFALGYIVSSLIQVLVTRNRMQRMMGDTGAKSVAIGTFFGFISSSCSFAALSTTRALFQKGAGLVPALAFMLASTNLVVELGIVIAIFLSWHFVVGEYVGGMLLILVVWFLVRLTKPDQLVSDVRKHLEQSEGDDEEASEDWKEKISSWQGWQQIGHQYVMEWQMVWKDVLIGFTIAGVISAFVPDTFFEMLFVGSGSEQAANPHFGAVLAQTLIGPVAAFATFIGSMGNIPLAALLYDKGVSFAGVMAFIFSDLVVLPVLRINATYYGWKMAFYILGLLLVGLVVVSIGMHYGLVALNMLPHGGSVQSITQRDFFQVDYGFILNIVFVVVSMVLGWFWWTYHKQHSHHHHDHGSQGASLTDYILRTFVGLSLVWLGVGLIWPLF